MAHAKSCFVSRSGRNACYGAVYCSASPLTYVWLIAMRRRVAWLVTWLSHRATVQFYIQYIYIFIPTSRFFHRPKHESPLLVKWAQSLCASVTMNACYSFRRCHLINALKYCDGMEQAVRTYNVRLYGKYSSSDLPLREYLHFATASDNVQFDIRYSGIHLDTSISRGNGDSQVQSVGLRQRHKFLSMSVVSSSLHQVFSSASLRLLHKKLCTECVVGSACCVFLLRSPSKSAAMFYHDRLHGVRTRITYVLWNELH